MQKTFLLLFVILFLTQNHFAQNCAPTTAFTFLEANRAKAGLLNGGDFFWDLNSGQYYVPADSITKCIFAGALWLGGVDAMDNLHVAAQTYRQTGNDYWAGPLDNNGNIDEANCGLFDRFWKTTSADIDAFLTTYAQNPTNITAEDVPESLLQWPAKGNPHFTDFSLPNQDLAPFFDANSDGLYNPLNGDFPTIRPYSQAYADQMIWWIFNDVGNIHTETGGLPLGMEVGALAYAFADDAFLEYQTFYRLTLRYKGSEPLIDFVAGLFVDPDLGNYQDDFVGCDTLHNIGFVYNGDAMDEGSAGYGAAIPAVGVQVLEGIKNNEGIDNKMSGFVYYNNNFTPQGNPETTKDFYSYLQNKWKDGTPFTYGGDGYGGDTPTNYMFPGEPCNPNGWSEGVEDNTPEDRRFLLSSGNTTLFPQQEQIFHFAVLYAKPELLNYPCPAMPFWADFSEKTDSLVQVINTVEEPLGIAQTNILLTPDIRINSPVQDYFYIHTANAPMETYRLKLYNVQGALVSDILYQNEKNTTILKRPANLLKGIYFYTIESAENERRINGKIMLD
ncbi:MAG: T9SS type A sorting domain-containing protein [Chitinophagales bacterium]|nr:T9SS type A sorting domain-containing protein [Bacteroidota bacterium]MCB9043465.1 T9SS type A sorting domain-containing protein [Chitinophagales bacterium]